MAASFREPPRALTEAEFAHVDALLGRVIEEAGEFDSFHVDFATRNANRLDRYGVRTLFTKRQWKVIREIETRAARLDEDPGSESGARG